jgi:hypothetical protein
MNEKKNGLSPSVFVQRGSAELFAFSSTMGLFISLLDGKVEFCALDSLLIIQSLKGFIRGHSGI